MVNKQVWLMLLLIGVGAGVGAGAAYEWQRATALPPSRGVTSSLASLRPTLQSSPGHLLNTRLDRLDGGDQRPGRRVHMEFNEKDLNQLVAAGLNQLPQARAMLGATQSITTSIEGDRVKGGVVITPARLDPQSLPGRAGHALNRALDLFPALADRPLYLGLEARPQIEDGRLVLGDDTRVQVGRMTLTLADVARLTGVTPVQINQAINQALATDQLRLEQIRLGQGQARLEATMPPGKNPRGRFPISQE